MKVKGMPTGAAIWSMRTGERVVIVIIVKARTNMRQVRCFMEAEGSRWLMWYSGRSPGDPGLDAVAAAAGSVGAHPGREPNFEVVYFLLTGLGVNTVSLHTISGTRSMCMRETWQPSKRDMSRHQDM